MDMVQATGAGGVPDASTTMSGAALAGPQVSDGDKASPGHGFLMALVALVLIPFDVIIIGLFNWPKLHILTSSLSLFVVLTATGLGIYVSTEFNRVRRHPEAYVYCSLKIRPQSKHFNSAHQVIGFLSIGGLLVLSCIGIYLRQMQRTAEKSDRAAKGTVFTSIHTWSARCIWVLLIINNGL